MVEVFVVFGFVPARRGERVGVGAREPRAVGKVENIGRVADAERDKRQFTRTDVDEGVYVLVLACVAVVIFVHVEAKKESFGRDKEKDALILVNRKKHRDVLPFLFN